MGITNANTFMYRNSRGLGTDLFIRPDGSRYERTYSTTKTTKKNSWLGILGKALISGLAAGASVYAQQAVVPRVPVYTPTTRNSNYSASTIRIR